MPKIYSRALTESEINDLIREYPIDVKIQPDTEPWASQYDERSAAINYALVRDFKPRVVVEFGARGGRCSRDITQALMDNGGQFIMRPYEVIDGYRANAQSNLNNFFGDKAPKVGGNILKAKDIPKGVEYLFVDNCHDEETTKWVFEVMLPWFCKPNCLVHFHDLYIEKDWEISSPHGESQVIADNKKVLSKVYWAWEEGNGRSSAWFQYKP